MAQGDHRQGITHQNSICASGFHGAAERLSQAVRIVIDRPFCFVDQISWTHGRLGLSAHC